MTDSHDHLPVVPPALRADSLLLRPWSLDDADEVLVLADDPVTRRFSPGLRPVQDRDAARAWIETRIARRTDWAVIDIASGRLAGRTGLHHHSPEDGAAEIGYGVTAAFRRQGVARRVVETVSAYGFAPAPDGLGLNRISLKHVVGNTGSCRTAWAAGFAPEGTAREEASDSDGGFDDMHNHARLASDPPGPLPRVAPAEPVEIAAGAYQLCVPDPDLDATAVAEALADPLIARWNAGPTGLDGARDWCRRRGDWTDGTHASWAVKEAVGGRLVGAVSVFSLDAVASAGQAGYWVAPHARGRGVAAAALMAAARFTYGLGVERLELFHAVENLASCRVAQKAGFALEGTHRRSHRYGDGELHDEHCHARLATDPD